MDNNYLDTLESEAIYILREVAGQFKNPYILFSGGKDSIVLLHLAVKAFKKGFLPFKLLHIDTGHNFQEVLSFRDYLVNLFNAQLEVRYVKDTMRKKGIEDQQTKYPSRNAFQTYTLLESIKDLAIDACVVGARRDEEKARAKERIFSVRDAFGQWNPKLQKPELWNNLNGKIKPGEHIRAFPISNWTELDVWQYIQREKIELPALYFSHLREVIQEDNKLIALSPYINVESTDKVVVAKVRYRTVGDMTCTSAITSEAGTIQDVIDEILISKFSERGQTRMDDQVSESAMEDRKAIGYF